MRRALTQKGMTLVITLIMLVVLTLLVVSAIRFGNMNLQIAGNMQTRSEAVAATQVAIERVVEQIKAAPNIDAIPASTSTTLPVSTGGTAYKVSWSKPVCELTKPITNADLDPSKAADMPCFESADGDKSITASGATTTSLSACNDQQWRVQASVSDPSTGVNVTSAQGLAVRVSAQVKCP